jgi:hypothetical protein
MRNLVTNMIYRHTYSTYKYAERKSAACTLYRTRVYTLQGREYCKNRKFSETKGRCSRIRSCDKFGNLRGVLDHFFTHELLIVTFGHQSFVL